MGLYYLARATFRYLGLLLCLLGLSAPARAANYYWVSNSGTWTDMSHWASTSGGAGNAYANVPKNTDNVYFDANSFAASNQRVTIAGTVTCNDMTWSGNVRQATLLQGASGVLEINGNLRYTATMAATPAIAVPHRMLAAAMGAVVDMQGVPFGALLLFDSANGGWTFTSTFNGASGTLVNISAARLVSFGSTTLTFSILSTNTGTTATASTVAGTLDLGSSTTTLLVQASPGALTLTNPNLTLTAGTSTLNVGASSLTTFTSPVSFTTAKAFAFNRVAVNSGNGAVFTVANSSFNALTVSSRLTLNSAATISASGSLTLGADAALLVAPGAARALSFGSGAALATSGGCAGFGTVQSALAGSPAILARSGGWASVPLSYVTLQDLTFTDGSSGYPANGAAVATASANQGGNSGITITALPVTDLYWVGNSGSWHDPSHWASTSGGPTAGNACVPNVFTNVHFDANSFTATGRAVTLDLPGQQCRSMDWTGVTNRPALNAASRCALTVAGSLTLVGPASLTQALAADLFLGLPGGGSYTLTTAGQPLAAHLWFRAPGGSYALLDDVTTTGRVFVESGSFITNDHTVNAQAFSSGYGFNYSVYGTGSGPGSPVSLSPPAVNLGASVLNLLGTNTRSDANALATNYAWDVASVDFGDDGGQYQRHRHVPEPAVLRLGRHWQQQHGQDVLLHQRHYPNFRQRGRAECVGDVLELHHPHGPCHGRGHQLCIGQQCAAAIYYTTKHRFLGRRRLAGPEQPRQRQQHGYRHYASCHANPVLGGRRRHLDRRRALEPEQRRARRRMHPFARRRRCGRCQLIQ
jgi:hypothetical protein